MISPWSGALFLLLFSQSSAATPTNDSMWSDLRPAFFLVALVVVAQAALIVALVRLVRRRRKAQLSLGAELQFQRLLSELSASLTEAPLQDNLLESALSRTAAGMGIEHVWCWTNGAVEDGGWMAPAMRSGAPVIFTDVRELPATIRAKLDATGAAARLTVAVPMMRDGAPAGALFWASRGPIDSWPIGLDEMGKVASVVGTALQRRQEEAALRHSDHLKGAVLESLPAQVAVLDRDGIIIAVNAAWTEFGNDNGLAPGSPATGRDYLAICRDAVAAGSEGAGEALAIIEATCRGEQSDRYVEYRCDSRDEARWFVMTAKPLRRAEGGAVVSHSNITTRKLSDIALRDSEDRFRRLADALPVAVWMSEIDGRNTYFNRQWLRMTGRPLSAEAGSGWVEGVHPDDRERCLNAYRSAFDARHQFTIDYRLRQSDGQYRWVMCIAEPRYRTDGTFHGYVGGCIDITERRDAEQVLRGLNHHLIMGQEEERRRIARELHDHLSQQLALLAIDLQQLTIHPPADADLLVAALQGAWRRTSEIASDVHGLTHRLHPSKLEVLGLLATIRAHCHDVSRQHMTARFSDEGTPDGIPSDVSLCLFRVVEEALANVVRHSDATEAHVTLRGNSRELVLRVRDTGRGFSSPTGPTTGLGLVSMRERVKALGGTLTITSSPGRGTIVEAHVPRARIASPQLDATVLT